MIKVGIIGCGRIAGGFETDKKREHPCTHAGAYKKNKHTKIVAISDINSKKLRSFSKQWKVKNAYTDYKKMLKCEKDLDIISICTHEATHSRIVLNAVKNKVKIILCEKPIAQNIVEAKKMLEVCKKHKKKLIVNHSRTWNNSFILGKKFIDKKSLGKVISVNANYTSGLYVMGTHMIDMLKFLFGDIKNIFGFKEDNKKIKKLSYSENYSINDPSYNAIIFFKNNVIGYLNGTCKKRYFEFTITVNFEKGNLSIEDNGKILIVSKRIQDKIYKKIIRPKKKPTMMENLINNIVLDLLGKKKINSNAIEAYETLRNLIKIKENKIV